MFNGCIRWRYDAPLGVFPSPTLGMWSFTYGKGKEVHEEIIDKGLLEKHVVLYLAIALVDMYAKSGELMNVCGSLRAIEKGKKIHDKVVKNIWKCPCII